MLKIRILLTFVLAFGCLSVLAESSKNLKSILVKLQQDQKLSSDYQISFSLQNGNLNPNLHRSALEKMCHSLREEKNKVSPFEVEEFSSYAGSAIVFNWLNAYRSHGVTCQQSTVVFREGENAVGTMTVHYEGEVGKITIAFSIDSAGKVKNLSIVSRELQFKKEMIESSDGKKLSTYWYSLMGDNRKKPTVLIRSPYLNKNFSGYLMVFNQFLVKGFNVVYQATRGTYTSEGDFLWLHSESNIEDSRSAIQWIKEQDLSNGKVLLYGVSYDGFSALTGAATNEEGILGAIACSAPSNARTDSFLGGEKTSLSVLNYSFMNTIGGDINTLREKANYIISEKEDGLENLDLYLTGRKQADWKDLFSSSLAGDKENYWNSRNIIPYLIESEIPIFHIAGFKDDQDSRDTVLAFEAIQKQVLKDNHHFLYLHGDDEGHSCGDFLDSKAFENFINGDYQNIPKATIYSQKKGDVVELDSYDNTIGRKLILRFENFRKSDELFAFDSFGDSASELVLSAIVDQDVYLNGRIQIKLDVDNQMAYTPLRVELEIQRRDGSSFSAEHSYDDMSTNLGTYLLKEDFGQSKSLILNGYPMLKKISAGSRINIKLRTSFGPWEIDLFSKQRDTFYKEKGMSRGQFFVKKSSRIVLPIEGSLGEIQ